MKPILEAKDISLKKGGKEILHVEHFAIHKSEIIAVVGPNGAKESTPHPRFINRIYIFFS